MSVDESIPTLISWLMYKQIKIMNTYILKNIKYLLVFSFFLLMASCSSDDNIEKKESPTEAIDLARNFLTGDVVLSTHATLNGVNKTLLPTGCPTRFNFTWSATDKNAFTLKLEDFTIGEMPFSITYTCDAKFMPLNSWEKNEYKGEGWMKFNGTDGYIVLEKDGKPSTMKGSFVKGYYNVNTHEINFIVDYNMMNVRSECFLQTIDKSRTSKFDAEFKKYEADLAAYKKEHGL